MTLTELHVYRLKVGLPTYRWGVPGSMADSTSMVTPGSHVWLDQIAPDGWAVLGLFTEEGQIDRVHYARLPVEYADDQLEEVLDETGKPEVLIDSAP